MAENRGKYLKFIWKVKNFSFCWKMKNDFLESPTFYLDNFVGSAWRLKLYPRGKESYENYLGVHLERVSSRRGPPEITIDFEITLIRRNGENEYIRKMEDRPFPKGQKLGFDNLIAREIVLGRRKSILLPEDTLTLQCCIFPKDAELKNHKEVIAKTDIEVECYRLQWKNFDYTRESNGSKSVTFHCKGDKKIIGFDLNPSKDSYYHPEILSIKFFDATNLKSLHFKIRVLDSKNSVAKILENHIFHDNSSWCKLVFPLITVPELIKKKDLYLPNDKLNLDCDLTLCYGLQHSQIEAIAQKNTFKFVPVDETASTSEIDLPRNKSLYCIDDTFSSLKNDIQSLYQEGTFCDFTIKAGDKNFKVHKAVVCARSPVFKAMLTSNLKESEKNMMDLSDLEEDIVHRMLTFMYTDMADDLDWDTAKKLYFAADKYGLTALKRICSEVLKQNVNVTNVKEVLELADMHSDEDLKKITVEFICHHETQIMFSTEWDNFMTEESQLAAETMHTIILKKAIIRH